MYVHFIGTSLLHMHVCLLMDTHGGSSPVHVRLRSNVATQLAGQVLLQEAQQHLVEGCWLLFHHLQDSALASLTLNLCSPYTSQLDHLS